MKNGGLCIVECGEWYSVHTVHGRMLRMVECRTACIIESESVKSILCIVCRYLTKCVCVCVCVCEQAAEAMQQNIQCSTAVYQLQGEGFEGLTEEKKSHFSQLQTLPRLLCF